MPAPWYFCRRERLKHVHRDGALPWRALQSGYDFKRLQPSHPCSVPYPQCVATASPVSRAGGGSAIPPVPEPVPSACTDSRLKHAAGPGPTFPEGNILTTPSWHPHGAGWASTRGSFRAGPPLCSVRYDRGFWSEVFLSGFGCLFLAR